MVPSALAVRFWLRLISTVNLKEGMRLTQQLNIFFFFYFAAPEYYDVVKSSLATYSNDCVAAVQKSIQQVEILLKHRVGMISLNDKFK